MILQSTQYTCGPCSIVNALASIGVTQTETEVMLMTEASPIHGTSPTRVRRTLRTLGYTPVELYPRARTRPTRSSVHCVAWDALREELAKGRPVLLLVDKDEHWVAAVGTLGDRILVADSAEGPLVISYERPAFMSRWRGKGSTRPYYGVIVSKEGA